jgi:hypothetical protein
MIGEPSESDIASCPLIQLKNGTWIEGPKNEIVTKALEPIQTYAEEIYDTQDNPLSSGEGSIFEDGDMNTNKGDNDNDDNNRQEKTENCGGESCTATEKEDSWTDDQQPYCDELSSEENDYQPLGCWDRKDYYQGGELDGLYPCRDGTAKEDWRDCD